MNKNQTQNSNKNENDNKVELKLLKDLIVTALTENKYTRGEEERCEDILQILDAYHYNTYISDSEGDLINKDINNYYYRDIGKVFLDIYNTPVSNTPDSSYQTKTQEHIMETVREVLLPEETKLVNVNNLPLVPHGQPNSYGFKSGNSGFNPVSKKRKLSGFIGSNNSISVSNHNKKQLRTNDLVFSPPPGSGGKRTRKNRCNKKRNTKSRKGNAGKKTYKRRQRKKNKTRRKRSS